MAKIVRDSGIVTDLQNYSPSYRMIEAAAEIANALWAINGNLKKLNDNLEDASNENLIVEHLESIADSLSDADPEVRGTIASELRSIASSLDEIRPR